MSYSPEKRPISMETKINDSFVNSTQANEEEDNKWEQAKQLKKSI